MEENAVQEAASGLESVNKLIRLLSQKNQQNLHQSSTSTSRTSMDMEIDCKAVADAAVSKFKKVISLLGRNRTGHARFRRAPVSTPPINQRQELSYQVPEANTKVYYATPIQQIPPPVLNQNHYPILVPNNGVMERKDSATTTINFSYSSAGNSFVSSLTGDTDSKQPSSSSAFQFTNVSQVSSAGKPPLSTSSLKRKCSSENLDSAGKCGSPGRCHCSKKRYIYIYNCLFPDYDSSVSIFRVIYPGFVFSCWIYVFCIAERWDRKEWWGFQQSVWRCLIFHLMITHGESTVKSPLKGLHIQGMLLSFSHACFKFF